ncbi:MAG: aminotransferase class III-fold pyridoxal phosphate-dependent enzyme, partial [Pseudomonadales bacterium]|jgi:adenosylmethionine-8-amino-7-oxononanoate aminotransferase|nr:aminotransferase class III-fold pyridoxal phosphate-dependent enzyme [Pseudomonadales bacterium]
MQPDLWPFVPGRSSVRVVRSEGSTLYTEDGRAILDAAGGAVVVNVGHGRRDVAEALAEEAERLAYVVPPWSTPSREALVERLRADWLPPALTRAYFASGGSEANETAMKVAVQHFAARGEPRRTKIVGRSLSYHGTTITTTAVGGHASRRLGLEGLLASFPQAPTPYPLRSPLGRHHPDTGRWCAEALEEVLEREGPETVAAFIAEPIVGSSGGALVPPDDYWPAVRALCDRHGILLILDEVMTGFGRTGVPFAGAHWGVTPDLLVSGKGLSGGYAPIGGVFATDAVLAPIAERGADVMFHTFGAHTAACAAAERVLRILRDEQLVERAARMGEHLATRLADAFADHPHVAETRGRGLLQAVEVVKDRETLEPFPAEAKLTTRIVEAGIERGVFFYPGGTGEIRDVVCFGPPFVVTETELDTMVAVLREAVDAAIGSLR